MHYGLFEDFQWRRGKGGKIPLYLSLDRNSHGIEPRSKERDLRGEWAWRKSSEKGG